MLFSCNYPALALQRAATALGSPHKVRRPYRSTEVDPNWAKAPLPSGGSFF
jgi:hypothetical protein